MFEKFIKEHGKISLVLFRGKLLVQVLFDKSNAGLKKHLLHEPGNKAVRVDDSNKYQPEPDKQVDHLVEEVNWQDTLNCISLNVAKTTDFQITKCDARKMV